MPAVPVPAMPLLTLQPTLTDQIFSGGIIRIAGHSLGNQMAVRLTRLVESWPWRRFLRPKAFWSPVPPAWEISVHAPWSTTGWPRSGSSPRHPVRRTWKNNELRVIPRDRNVSRQHAPLIPRNRSGGPLRSLRGGGDMRA